MLRKVVSCSVLASVAVGALILVGMAFQPAQAQAQSCGQLWYARNSIYSAAGYCFKTPQAIGAFGEGCFPPYGRLTPSQQAQVNAIKAQERRQGCTR